MAQPIPPKKTRGQQKIELKMMTDDKRRSVTFTKRRTGLFKKAGQLCTLTGAEVALMVFSPGGKVFTFGSPDVDAVIEKYKSQVPPSPRIARLNAELREVMEQLAFEDKRAEELKKKRQQMMKNMWWAAPFHTLSRAQQELVMARLIELDNKLANPPVDFNSDGSTVAPLPQNPAFECGSTSSIALFTQTPILEGSSSTAPSSQSQVLEGKMVLPHENLFTCGSSSASATAQNQIFEGNMVLPHDNFLMCGSSSATQNQMFEGNMVQPRDNFFNCGSSWVSTAQNQMFEGDMMLAPLDTFYPGESSKAPVVENQMYEDNMMLTAPNNFYSICESSLAPANPNKMFEDNMAILEPDNFYTSGSFVADENNMAPPHDNFYACGSSEAPLTEHLIFNQNMVSLPPDDHFYGSSSLMDPQALNQMSDRNVMPPWLPPNDPFYGSGSSMAPPASYQMSDVMLPPLPPSYSPYGEPSGFY